MINSTDLRYFLSTAQHLHLTRAAKALGISQPALSHCLKRLEAELGDGLFLRRKNGLILTEAGQYLMLSGQKIVDDLEAVATYISTGKKLENRTLHLGLHPSVGSYVLPELYKNSGNIKLKFSFGLSKLVTQMVQEGKLDCAIAINPYAHPNLVISPLADDQFNLWAPKKNVASEKNLFFDPNLEQSQFIIRQLDKKNIKFDHFIEIPNLELIAKNLYEGVGCAILPSRVVHGHSEEAKLVKLYSQEIKPFKDKICFVYSEENKYKEELRNLKTTLSAILK